MQGKRKWSLKSISSSYPVVFQIKMHQQKSERKKVSGGEGK